MNMTHVDIKLQNNDLYNVRMVNTIQKIESQKKKKNNNNNTFYKKKGKYKNPAEFHIYYL